MLLFCLIDVLTRCSILASRYKSLSCELTAFQQAMLEGPSQRGEQAETLNTASKDQSFGVVFRPSYRYAQMMCAFLAKRNEEVTIIRHIILLTTHDAWLLC